MKPSRPDLSPSPASARPPAEVIPLHRAESDASLVDSLRKGDVSAGHALFAAHGAHVRRVLVRVMGPDSEIADLVQDVFVAALESIDKLDDPRALRGWLAQIAVFRARRCLRGRKQWSILRFFAPEEMPQAEADAQDFEASEALRATYRVLATLPVDERIAFTLRYVEGMELTEVAATCRVSLATTKRRIARGEARFTLLAQREASLEEWVGGAS